MKHVTLQEMIEEVRRELLERSVGYSRKLKDGTMNANVAKKRNACLNAVLVALEQMREIERVKEKNVQAGDRL